MSSWRLKMSKCTGTSGVQTLEDLRNRLRTEAMCGNDCEEPRDDLFPNGEECLDIDGPPCEQVEQEIQQEQLPVPEHVPVPTKTPAKRRTTKKEKTEKTEKAKSAKAVQKLCPPADDEDKPEDEPKSDDIEHTYESGDAEGGASGRSPSDLDNLDEMDDSDLMLAFSTILADFKDLTHRVKCLSTVLTDVQAAGVRRSFSALGKALNEAAAIASTGAKPAAAPRKKKAAASKK
ncbi:late transcription factor VLTF4 [Pseudocowpox virus]|uniref:Late transcription factor VLTF4 n=1 Tax=Pseudocowpox virus TaxID=129726 RepID=D3IZK8_9POXV|nr:late transcription factor VLTF4 [Pseudocowpox virus]ADC53962.1 late transcription factor VLTF4 [Pseudocowpox virus]